MMSPTARWSRCALSSRSFSRSASRQPTCRSAALLLAQHLGLHERFKPAVMAYWQRLRQRDGYQLHLFNYPDFELEPTRVLKPLQDRCTTMRQALW